MDIPLFKVYMNPKAGDTVKEVLDSGYIGQGKIVEHWDAIQKIPSDFNTQ